MESPVNPTVYKFLSQEHTADTLGTMSIDDLLSLRNLVATNLGVSTVKSFKDHETAVAQTIKALERYQGTVAEEQAAGEAPAAAAEKPAKTPKAPKEPKEPKDRKLAKPAGSQMVKRPTRKMFATIHILKEHTGVEGRGHRWPNYRDGMTLVEVIEGEGTVPWDVYNWTKHGLMEVREPSDEEYAQRRAAWYAKEGREDPDAAKERQAAEAAAKKAAREQEAAAKRAAKEAEAAAKKAAKAAATAETTAESVTA